MPGTQKKPYKKRSYKRKSYKKKANVNALINKAIKNNNYKMLETKKSLSSNSDGAEIFNNTPLLRNSELLRTGQGITDPTNTNALNRIGDKINVLGLSVKCCFELNERYSMATYRVFIVKSAKGDVPDKSTMFNGNSTNKMIDTLNRERYTFLLEKVFTIRQSSTGMQFNGVQEIGSGFTSGYSLVSRATKIVTLWVPGYKLAPKGVLTYENATAQPKMFDYHLIYYVYSNYSTATTFYTGRIADEVITLYYKDA